MSGIDLLRAWKRRNPQIENIVLFVSDALRWDYAPKSVLSRGVTFRAVASGIQTPISFPSIVTGLHPQHHGVYSFHEGRLPKDASSLLNLDGYNTSIWTENCWTGYNPPNSSPLYSILRHRNRVSLKEIEPPFIYLEDEKGGHCPYGWSAAKKEYEEWDCLSFFRDFGKREERELRKKYEEGVQRSAQEFESRLRVIDERGLADETLVVFLSDHGELLGEHGGVVGHKDITAPEVVYVPIVFIHPDLPEGKNFEKEGVLRHVDLYPTICEILDVRVGTKSDGVSLFDVKKLPSFGFSFFVEKMKTPHLRCKLEEVSVWDKDGGYVFREGDNFAFLLLRALYLTALSNNSLVAIYQRQRLRRSPATLKNYHKLLQNFYRPFTKYGSPSLSVEQAEFAVKKLCEQTSETAEKVRIKRIVRKLKDEGRI